MLQLSGGVAGSTGSLSNISSTPSLESASVATTDNEEAVVDDLLPGRRVASPAQAAATATLLLMTPRMRTAAPAGKVGGGVAPPTSHLVGVSDTDSDIHTGSGEDSMMCECLRFL